MTTRREETGQLELTRCDRCSAAAQLRAVLPAGELLFCGHHARKYRAGLLDVGAHLVAAA